MNSSRISAGIKFRFKTWDNNIIAFLFDKIKEIEVCANFWSVGLWSNSNHHPKEGMATSTKMWCHKGTIILEIFFSSICSFFKQFWEWNDIHLFIHYLSEVWSWNNHSRKFISSPPWKERNLIFIISKQSGDPAIWSSAIYH